MASLAMPKRRANVLLGPDRIAKALHTGGVSIAGLAKLIRVLTDGDVGESRTRLRLLAANAEHFDSLECIDTLRMQDGTDWDWSTLEPGRLLALLVAESDELQRILSVAWTRSPPTAARPWSLVIGFDEFVPGNKLACDHSRKTMVLSFSFKELGSAALSRGVGWTTPVVVRAAKIAQVAIVTQDVSRLGRCSMIVCYLTHVLIHTATSSLTQMWNDTSHLQLRSKRNTGTTVSVMITCVTH